MRRRIRMMIMMMKHLKKPGLSNMALKSLRVAWPTGRGRLGGC